MINYMGVYWRSRDGTMHTFPTVYPRIQPLLLLELRLRGSQGNSFAVTLGQSGSRGVQIFKIACNYGNSATASPSLRGSEAP